MRAYTTLIASLLCGIAVSSVDYILSAPAVSLAFLAGLGLVLVLSRLALKRSFRNYARMELRLYDSHLDRFRGSTSEQFRLADVAWLKVVRTCRGSIREITARLGDGRRMSVNGVEDFEQFGAELRGRIPAGAAFIETREPIDYDHPLFYVVFGGLTGIVFTLVLRAMSTLGRGGLKWATLGIAAYSFALGIYVLIARPLAQRYGPQSRFGDVILGAVGLLAGIMLAASSLFGWGS